MEHVKEKQFSGSGLNKLTHTQTHKAAHINTNTADVNNKINDFQDQNRAVIFHCASE